VLPSARRKTVEKVDKIVEPRFLTSLSRHVPARVERKTGVSRQGQRRRLQPALLTLLEHIGLAFNEYAQVPFEKFGLTEFVFWKLLNAARPNGPG
jgi:hypothetical protein